MYHITKEDIERKKKEIELIRERQKYSINLFNPEWSCTFPKNSLVIIGAGSGIGKTTFVRQCIKEGLRDRLKMLIFSNEELKSSIEQNLVDSMMLEFPDMNEDEILMRILEYCYIIDLDDTLDLEYYDKVPALILTAIEDFKPDVVFFDQISYCDKSEDGKKRKPYEYLANMVKEFKEPINSDELLPPIVLIQQGKSIPGAGAGESNKDSSNTVRPCTHVIQLFRDGDNTYLEIQKYRYPQRSGYKRYTKFSYDPELDLFDFVEHNNKYEIKRGGRF